MNRPRNQAPLFWPVFLGVLFLTSAGFLTAWLLIRQNTADTRHRIAAIEREIDELRIERETIETQQAALLSTEAIKQRLAAAPNSLQEIEPGTVLVIGGAREPGVAMGGAGSPDL